MAVAVTYGAGWVRAELDEPTRLNPIGDAFWGDFERVVADLRDTPDVQVITITGRGRAFSAGGDVRRMWELAAAATAGQLDSEALEVERARLRRAHRVLVEWVALPALRIAAINGPAVGAGLALALTCDIRLMSAGAWLDTGFARLGLPGDCGVSYHLPRLIGPQAAQMWLQFPRRVAAPEALRLGLVDQLADSGRLEEDTSELVQRSLHGSPDASRWIRRPSDHADALAAALEAELDATIACKGTPFYAQALAALTAGKKP